MRTERRISKRRALYELHLEKQRCLQLLGALESVLGAWNRFAAALCRDEASSQEIMQVRESMISALGVISALDADANGSQEVH